MPPAANSLCCATVGYCAARPTMQSSAFIRVDGHVFIHETATEFRIRDVLAW